MSSARVMILVAGAACSASPHTTATCGDESPAFQLARLGAVRQASAAGEVVPALPFPARAVHDKCAAVDELVRPFCFEGAAMAYGEAVGSALTAGHDVTIADVEPQLLLADDRWSRIHCRGFGNGASELDANRLATLFAQLPRRCMLHAVDGFGAASAWSAADEVAACRTTRTPECDAKVEAFFAHFDIDQQCARWGADADWCAYGTGRMLANYFAGRFELATRTCRGLHRAACLAGIGFVTVYLYPDRIDRALRASVALPVADQPAFVEGLANGLQWRHESDAALLESSLAKLSPAAHRHALDILEAAAACGFVDFHSGAGCRWPALPRDCAP